MSMNMTERERLLELFPNGIVGGSHVGSYSCKIKGVSKPQIHAALELISKQRKLQLIQYDFYDPDTRQTATIEGLTNKDGTMRLGVRVNPKTEELEVIGDKYYAREQFDRTQDLVTNACKAAMWLEASGSMGFNLESLTINEKDDIIVNCVGE